MSLSIYSNEGNKHYEEMVATTEHLVEANSFEVLSLWQRFHQLYGYSWEQTYSGYMEPIGELDCRPVCISLRWDKVGGKLFCFYEMCSQVQDRELMREWIKLTFPGIQEVDAMNFHNALLHLEVRRPEGMEERHKAYREMLRSFRR
jgi:hypothetical protein